MAYNVNFKKGTATQYNSLEVKDVNTFYYTSDDSQLYLGTIKLSNAADLEAAITRIAANEKNIGDVKTLTTAQKADLVSAINSLKSEVSALTGGEGATGGISDMIAAVTGDLNGLDTDKKGTLVEAINEVAGEVDANKTAAVVTIEEAAGTEDDAYAKKYTIKQGGNALPVTIDVPKDMVVSYAEVRELTTEEITEARPQGTYIVLTIANATNDKLYINVGTLVDIYKAAENAGQVQIAIDQSNNIISASIVAGSISSTELAENAVIAAKIAENAVEETKIAANAVTTAKIADKNVTLAKLEQDVQDSLGKANSAVQSVTANTATTEEAKGSILVDGKAVKVNGLGTAAYANAGAFETAGTAAGVETNIIGNAGDAASADTIHGAKAYADSLAGNYATAEQGGKADSALQQADIATGTDNGTIKVKGTDIAVKGLGTAAYKNEEYFDKSGAASAAETNAKAYTDTALTWGPIA